MSGTVNISRRIWMDEAFAEEPFTEREAFIWLVMEASWMPRTKRVGTVVVDLQRGQLAASNRFMATAWSWSKSRVDRFLKRLKKRGTIGTASGTGVLVITISKYEEYQNTPNHSGTPYNQKSGQQRDSSGTNENKGLIPDVIISSSRSSAHTRENAQNLSEADQLYDEVISAVGLNAGMIPRYWMPPAATLHVWRWHSQLNIPTELIVSAAKSSRARHPEPPGGPRALDRVMQSLAGELQSEPMTPKVINGGNHEQSPGKSDRFQRIITAAAEGTSRQDWG